MIRTALVFALSVFPLTGLANGGPQNYVDGYIVSLSQSPFVPGAGERTAFILSIVDGETRRPLEKSIEIQVSVVDERDTVIHTFSTQIEDSYHEFRFTFPEDGIYHLDVDFTVEGEPMRSTHLLVGVKSEKGTTLLHAISLVIIAFLAGFLLLKRRTS